MESTGNRKSLIPGINTDYVDNGSSSIKFNTISNVGSRIAKIEFNNVGLYIVENDD